MNAAKAARKARIRKRKRWIYARNAGLVLLLFGVVHDATHDDPPAAAATSCSAAPAGRFNPCATLNPGQVIDARDDSCARIAARIVDTGEYEGSDAMRACVGEEDDPRVILLLHMYALNEKGSK